MKLFLQTSSPKETENLSKKISGFADLHATSGPELSLGVAARNWNMVSVENPEAMSKLLNAITRVPIDPSVLRTLTRDQNAPSASSFWTMEDGGTRAMDFILAADGLPASTIEHLIGTIGNSEQRAALQSFKPGDRTDAKGAFLQHMERFKAAQRPVVKILESLDDRMAARKAAAPRPNFKPVSPKPLGKAAEDPSNISAQRRQLLSMTGDMVSHARRVGEIEAAPFDPVQDIADRIADAASNTVDRAAFFAALLAKIEAMPGAPVSLLSLTTTDVAKADDDGLLELDRSAADFQESLLTVKEIYTEAREKPTFSDPELEGAITEVFVADDPDAVYAPS